MKGKEKKGNDINGNDVNGNFVIFENYKEYFENLSGEQVKLLMITLFDFAKHGER